MVPTVYVFGRDFTTFGLMFLLGAGAAAALIALLYKTGRVTRPVSCSDVLLTGCIAIAGAMAGGVLLQPIIRLPQLLMHWDTIAQMPVGVFFPWYFGQFVFYGGLIGGALAALWFCRRFKLSFLAVADVMAPAIPLGHAIGRVGCFLSGCCYGMEVAADHPLAVVYPPESLAAPSGVPLLAVPLIETACNIVICLALLLFCRKMRAAGRVLASYMVLYAAARFVLEFFRGDAARGIYAGLSTSQYISIGLALAGAALFVMAPRMRGKHSPAAA